VHTSELCADLVDVVIDISYIYGIDSTPSRRPGPPEGVDGVDGGLQEWGTPYDDQSASAIRLNTGTYA
jgi:hypothetical protein